MFVVVGVGGMIVCLLKFVCLEHATAWQCCHRDVGSWTSSSSWARFIWLDLACQISLAYVLTRWWRVMEKLMDGCKNAWLRSSVIGWQFFWVPYTSILILQSGSNNLGWITVCFKHGTQTKYDILTLGTQCNHDANMEHNAIKQGTWTATQFSKMEQTCNMMQSLIRNTRSQQYIVLNWLAVNSTFYSSL